MPAPEVSDLNQKAVLWAASGTYDADGEPNVAAAVEINARWERRLYESITSDATPVAITGQVMVDRVIPQDSIMWLGELADVPNPPTNLVQVVSFDEVPDIKGREYQRTVTLRKWKDDLPTITP